MCEMSRTSRTKTKTMASRDKPSKGYFFRFKCHFIRGCQLFFEPKRRNKNGGRRSGYWDVERLVERRERNETVEYLVQWKGYLPYEASWELEECILPRCIELFNRPSPDLSLILDNVCSFRVAVERHLKACSRLPVGLFFRGDVFHFLFAGKEVSREGWTFLKKKSL